MFGLATAFQLVPFQCSTSVKLMSLIKEVPTAQILSAERADTPSKKPALKGVGLRTILQFSPFQCSMSVLAELTLEVKEYEPTAQILSAERAVTLSKELLK